MSNSNYKIRKKDGIAMETKELIKSPDLSRAPSAGRPAREPAGKRISLYIRLIVSAAAFIAAVIISSGGGELSIKLSEYVAIMNSGGNVNDVFEAIGKTVAGQGSFEEIISALMPETEGGSGEIWERVRVPEGMELVPYTK
jgi:hypothetical protein